jgi:tetratricopeptide (TPR) repeat protein
LLKASLLEDAGRKDEARAALTRAIEVEEDRGQAAKLNERLGALEAELGHWSQASQALEKSVACNPDNADTYYHLGLSLKAAGDCAGLRRVNDELSARFGTASDPEICNSVAWTLILAEDAVSDPDLPVRLAETALNAAPERMKPLILNTLGVTLYRAGRFEDAIRRIEEGIQSRNGASDAQDWVFLALAHHRLGHRDKALSWLEKLRSPRPSQSRRDVWTDLDIRLFTDEAEAVIRYDPIFPTNPFAH